MSPLGFLLLLQASGWSVAPMVATVGDTVALTRRLTAAPDVEVRMQPLAATSSVEPLQAPQWSYAESAVTLVYRVAFFEAGLQRVSMPPIELVHADGHIEAIAGETALVEIRSVLPITDTVPSPMPSRAPIARTRRSPLALLSTVVAAVGILILWTVLSRRRRSVVLPAERAVEPATPPLDLWIAAGESRAVAAVVASRLRDLVARRLPDAGGHLDTEECVRVVLASDLGEMGRQIASTLRALERARFSPAAPGDLLEVADRADTLIGALEHELEAA